MSSTDQFKCDHCDKRYVWKPGLAGKKVRCKCGAAIHVPMSMGGSAEDLMPDSEESAMPSDSSDATCPSCNAGVKSTAVICVSCGYNLKSGRKLKTETGKVRASSVRTGEGGAEVAAGAGVYGSSLYAAPRRMRHNDAADGFFGRIKRGWEFAKISYGIIWDFKSLMLFPIFSVIASVIVIASFVVPLFSTGMMERMAESEGQQDPLTYIVLFAFYFCSYFVIVFFNTALTACAMKVVEGDVPRVSYGLSIAVKRVPQIAAWALVSAVVGTILKVIENSSEKLGKFITAVIGTGWTILTFFVVPVLCVEGVGPFTAVKKSFETLQKTWGEGVVGNFSIGVIAFLVTLPIYVLLIAVGIMSNNGYVFFACILLFLAVAIVSAIASSAAEGVFKALLYNYASGRSLPEDIDESLFASAFADNRG